MRNILSLALLTLAASTFAVNALAQLDATPQTRLDASLRCLLGAYTLRDGNTITITGVDGTPRGLQYTLANGKFGNLQEKTDGTFHADALEFRFAPCSVGRLKLKRSTVVDEGVRIPLIEKTTTFSVDGAMLFGKLVMPQKQAQALAVWVEGSNNNPSTDDTVWQYELARRGVAVFVYDKRGTGASSGAQSSDFHLRARDTAAAVREAQRLAPHILRVGVIGASQGGWVAPLTANMLPLDFVVAAFALAESPIAQDQALVMQQLRDINADANAIAEAKALTAITERIVRAYARSVANGTAQMDDGLAELDAFKAKHTGRAWLDAIQPRSYTGLFLKFTTEQIKAIGPKVAQNLTFDYEPRPVIESIKSRQLWLLGGNDRQAPSDNTRAILSQLQKAREDVAVIVFPNADHGLIETVKSNDDTVMTYSAMLFDRAADWIKASKTPAQDLTQRRKK
jgi:uncharacterized protein